MFCCSVCNVMFNGVYPEIVLTTPCGHLFHSECILLCLKKSLKCPFCTLHVQKSQLIKLYFQIDTNWKDTAAALKTKANTSVIELDESMNETIRDLTLGSISIIEIDADQSTTGIDHDLPALCVNNQIENSVYCAKTLLTTGLSGIDVSKTVKDLLLIFNDIIPNSTILRRELVSEQSLVSSAMNHGYTNIIIINMQFGKPVGLTFFDLLAPFKTFATLTSFGCFKYENIVSKIEKPQLVMNYNKNLMKGSHELILQFFSTILPKKSGCEFNDAKTINITYCNDCQSAKFEFNSAGLHFCMVPTITNI